MPKAKTLTVEEVARLGAERLAALLLEAAEHDLGLMRSLRVAVASRVDASAVASEIDQQVRGVRRSTAFVDHRKLTALARDLGTLWDAIARPLGDLDPAAALSRMLDFIALASLCDRNHSSQRPLRGRLVGRCHDTRSHLWTPPCPDREQIRRSDCATKGNRARSAVEPSAIRIRRGEMPVSHSLHPGYAYLISFRLLA